MKKFKNEKIQKLKKIQKFKIDDIGRVLRVVGYSSIAKQKFCEVVNYGLNNHACRRVFLLKALVRKIYY